MVIPGRLLGDGSATLNADPAKQVSSRTYYSPEKASAEVFEGNMKDSKKKVLHDPIAYKARVSDINFTMPRKERATTGRFMPPGSNYGSGYRNPVGTEKANGIESGPIPFGCSAFDPDEAIRF